MLFSLAYWHLPAGFALPKLLCLSLTAVWASWRMLTRPSPSPAWLLFFLPILLSASISPDPWLSIVGRYNAYAWGLMGMSLCLILFYSDLDMVFPSGIILSIYAIYEAFGNGVLPNGNRVMSLIGSPVDLGVILSACILVWAPVWRRRGLIAGGVLLYALYLTGTRGAWIGLLAGAAYALGKRYLYLIAAIGIIILILNPRPVSDSARIEVWKAAIESIKEAPLLGHGPDSFEDSFKLHRSQKFMDIMGNKNGTNRSQADPHNLILAILSFFGILGMLFFFAFLYFVGVSPPLVAILTASLFNPISLEVMALAALLAGRLVRREVRPKWLAFSFMALALLCSYNALLLCKADYWYQRGNVAGALGLEEYPFYLEATKYNPTEPRYTAALINSIRGRNHDLAAEAISNLKRYRTSADTQMFSALVLRGAGSPVAKHEIDRAIALDPLNPKLLSVRREFK